MIMGAGRITPIWVFVCGFGPALLSCGVPFTGVEPFTSSSLKHNRDRPHRLLVPGSDLDPVVDRVITLAKQRQLILVHQGEFTGEGGMLSFRGAPEDRRVFRGPQTHTASYYSRYFITLRRKGNGVMVQGVGVPVFRGMMACPPILNKLISCRTPGLQSSAKGELVAGIWRAWGYDVSGLNEAEMLQGLLTELRREVASSKVSSAPGDRPSKTVGGPARASGAPADAVPRAIRREVERLRGEGRACYRRRDYRCALEKFQAAFDQLPEPAMRFNIASAQDKLGLAALAVRQYQQYLRDVGVAAPDAALKHITHRMASLRSRVARLVINVTPHEAAFRLNATVQRRDHRLRRSGDTATWSLVLEPGTFQLTFSNEGFLSKTVTLTLAAGQDQHLRIHLRRPAR